jgi:hypothetical protein
MRGEGVVEDGEDCALFEIGGRGELIAVELAVGVVGEGDQEWAGVGGDAEGEGVHPGKLVVAGGDFGSGFEPCRRGDRFGGIRGQRSSSDWRRGISARVRAALV